MIDLKEVKKAIRKQINKITEDDIRAGDYDFWTGDYKTIGINCHITFDKVEGKNEKERRN